MFTFDIVVDAMVFHYPNGAPYTQNEPHAKKMTNKNVIYGKRGMSLEDEINESNKFYLQTGVAVIHKKPTPVQIVDVYYPKRSAAVIQKAYFKQASTTDYNGVYNGKYLDFEAKETKNTTSFPLSNFHEHQVEHMRACQAQAGICFTIIRFVKNDQLFVLPAKTLFRYWDERLTGAKSIPKSVIETEGLEIQYGLHPRIPYLKYVDHLLESDPLK